jgi:hypothetical protein
MGFGVRTGKPPHSGESAAADLKERLRARRRGREDACEPPALPTQAFVGRAPRRRYAYASQKNNQSGRKLPAACKLRLELSSLPDIPSDSPQNLPTYSQRDPLA